MTKSKVYGVRNRRKGALERLVVQKEQLEKQKSDYESQWAGKEFGQSMRDSYKAEIEKRRAANKAKKANKANKDDKDNKDEPKEEDK